MFVPQQQVPGVATSAGPAITVASFGQIVLAWKGRGSDTGIYWSTSPKVLPQSAADYAWTPQQQVANIGASTGPALASFQNGVYMAWRGMGADSRVWWTTFDGTQWAAQHVGVGRTSHTPALAASPSQLIMAWKGQADDSQIYWSTSSDGRVWSPQQVIAGPGTSDAPALATVGHTVYLFWKGRGGDQRLYWSKCTDGQTWAPQQQIPGVASSTGPAACASFLGQVDLVWKGMNNDPGVWYSTLQNDGSWTPQTVIPEIGTSARPAIAANFVLAWKGRGTDEAIYCGQLSELSDAPSFSFQLNSFEVRATRAGSWVPFHTPTDTDFVSFSVAVGTKPAQVITKAMGDLEPGTYFPMLNLDATVNRNEVLVFAYAIANQGHNDSNANEKALGDAARTLASKGAEAATKALATVAVEALSTVVGAELGAALGTAVVPLIGTALGALAGWIVGSSISILWADCDGPVAAAVHVYTGAELRALTSGGRIITQTDDQPGVDSPPGCGGNSHYTVTWRASEEGNAGIMQ